MDSTLSSSKAFGILLLFFLSIIPINYGILPVSAEKNLEPPSFVSVPLNLLFGGNLTSFTLAELQASGLKQEYSISYVDKNNQVSPRLFSYKNEKIEVKYKVDLSFIQISVSEWQYLEQQVQSIFSPQTIAITINGTVRQYSGFQINYGEMRELLLELVPQMNGYTFLFFDFLNTGLKRLHWYKGDRFSTNLAGDRNDMRIGGSITNASIFVDLGATSWWLDNSLDPSNDTKLFGLAKNGDPSAMAQIINSYIEHVLLFQPMPKIPIIPQYNQYRLELVAISNTSLFYGNPSSSIELPRVITTLADFMPYFEGFARSLGTLNVQSIPLVKEEIADSIVDINGTRYVNLTRSLVNTILTTITTYMLPKTEKNTFWIPLLVFYLELPIFSDGSYKDRWIVGSDQGIVGIDTYDILRENNNYFERAIKYRALHGVPIIFGIGSPSRYGHVFDFIQDPLSSYDMDAKLEMRFSDFSTDSLARYYSILYNVSLISGIEETLEIKKKAFSYKWIPIDFSEALSTLESANQLFAKGNYTGSTILYMKAWDQYSRIRSKALSWQVGIESTKFFFTLVIFLGVLVFFSRDKVTREWVKNLILGRNPRNESASNPENPGKKR